MRQMSFVDGIRRSRTDSYRELWIVRASAALTIEWILIISLKKCVFFRWNYHLVHLNSFSVSTKRVSDVLLASMACEMWMSSHVVDHRHHRDDHHYLRSSYGRIAIAFIHAKQMILCFYFHSLLRLFAFLLYRDTPERSRRRLQLHSW